LSGRAVAVGSAPLGNALVVYTLFSQSAVVVKKTLVPSAVSICCTQIFSTRRRVKYALPVGVAETARSGLSKKVWLVLIN
jgi:hypothetical protein